MGYFCPKNTFLQLKHYIQGVYLIAPVIFETISHFSRHSSFVFFSSNITYFLQKWPSKVQILRLSTAQVKVHQIPHVIFQTKSQFLIKVWIFFQWHERQFFCAFLAESLYAIDKSSTPKCKFSDLPLLAFKFTKLLMSFLEPRVSFSSKFASLFSFMRQNSSLPFHLDLYMLWTKRANQSANFQAFNCSNES